MIAYLTKRIPKTQYMNSYLHSFNRLSVGIIHRFLHMDKPAQVKHIQCLGQIGILMFMVIYMGKGIL